MSLGGRDRLLVGHVVLDLPLQLRHQPVGLVIPGGKLIKGEEGLLDTEVFGEVLVDLLLAVRQDLLGPRVEHQLLQRRVLG